ncbi:MFS transporter [Enterococcus sp. 669A]|uniref:MFS transporter n=1 Tax=Candidatus Enterococcus moelleringii TaxID=2815325 RepID=A0ABS3LBZ6_9ENTE|nr:MFS transporter [Enterococcus sp. 669A]MBO1307157.1 MFS transporter [Enterococcus sp. 669A]
MENTHTSLKKNGMVLPIILLSYFMILLDNSIIFTGTVKIAQDLGLNQAQLSWVSNAYSLTFGGLLLLGGRSGDIFGRKKMYNIGLIIFAIGSLLVGLAGGSTSIILARAFQGIGSAILAPTTLAILMDNFEGEQRTKAVAAYGATAGIGSSVGLIIGGVLASQFSWRDGFFINVPISLVMIVLSTIFIQERETIEGKIDIVGSVTSVIGMLALVYSIVGESNNLLALVIAVVFIGLFIRQEAKTASPIMPLSLFKNKERLGAYIARFTFLGAMLSLWFLTPQMMQNYLGYSPLTSGLAFFPLSITIFLSSLLVSRLTKRLGNAKLMVIGLVIVTIGFIGLSLFNENSNYWLGIALPMAIAGVGQGFSLSPLTASGIANTTANEAGAASGVVNMVHQIGGSIGLSVVIALSASIADPVEGFHVQMMIATVLIVISLVVAVVFILPQQKSK